MKLPKFAKKTAREVAAAREAIASLGGNTSTALRISEHTGESINQDTVSKWKYTGVPPHYVLILARLAGVNPGVLDPVLYPAELIANAKEWQPLVRANGTPVDAAGRQGEAGA